MSELSERIRSRGHWYVNLQPVTYDETRIGSLAELERAFRQAHVQFRGWDYPHDPKDGVSRHKDHIEGSVSWASHHEVWRLYQSGQFIHLFALDEDWWEESGYGPQKVKPGQLLEVSGTLFTVTEMFVFASRLVEALKSSPEVIFTYKLVGLKNRQLQTLDPRRMPLHDWRKAASELHEYGREMRVAVPDLIARAAELAVDEVMAIYERFHWEPARQSVVEEQRRLLERRL